MLQHPKWRKYLDKARTYSYESENIHRIRLKINRFSRNKDKNEEKNREIKNRTTKNTMIFFQSTLKNYTKGFSELTNLSLFFIKDSPSVNNGMDDYSNNVLKSFKFSRRFYNNIFWHTYILSNFLNAKALLCGLSFVFINHKV